MQSNLFPQIEKNSRKTVIYQTNNRVKITRFNAGPGLPWSGCLSDLRGKKLHLLQLGGFEAGRPDN